MALMPRFQVLLHAPLYAQLRRQPPEVRSRFGRLVGRLREGAWGGGTSVKKLRGSDHPVFEARLDGADRVLFTLARSASPSGTGLASCLQIWDLVVHDRVSARASRMNFSAEAEFLGYEVIESELIDEPPAHAGATFPDLPASGGHQAGVVDLMGLSVNEFHPPEREDLIGGIRWYILPERLLADEAEWQSLVDQGSEELELKLTADQYAVVRQPGPVLLTGSAGSGKTTIAVHRLAAAACGIGAPSISYITYSRWLLDHAQRLFGDLAACRGVTPERPPDFLTVEDLYRRLVGEGEKLPDELPGFPSFASWYRAVFRRADAALAWEEIRSIVKGACLAPERPMLSQEAYESLGRKRAPLYTGERPRIYEVARRWQEHLTARRLLDEIDLCRLALSRLPKEGVYDVVVCDEAQDLSEVQVELLLRLVRDRGFRGLFLAGDPQQVINPSGFRWAEVRTAIRKRYLEAGRPTPELTRLTRNFRSVRPIVALANELLAIKRERTGRSDEDEAEESAVAGSAPILVDGAEGDLAKAAEGFGPRCAIVTGSEKSRARLQTLLQTTRVFTVPEAKGLEFDVVILWSVCAADPEPWGRLLDPAAQLREDPACRRALHHLYVGVTRARRHLAVYEPEGAQTLWTSPRFARLLDREEPSSLSRLFSRSAGPEEWIREGDYFLARGRHRQAAECFRRAGDSRRETDSLARHHDSAGEWLEAGRLWAAIGEKEKAAVSFEKGEAFAAAARLWEDIGQAERAGRCGAAGLEAARDWSGAAGLWGRLGDWAASARCWGNAGQRSRQLCALAEAGEAAGDHAEAGRRWEEARDWGRAAGAWRRAGREKAASRAEAEGHETEGRWGEAEASWREAGEVQRAMACAARAAESGKRWDAAAVAWEELGRIAEAADAWRRAGRSDRLRKCEIRLDMEARRFIRAAEALEETGELRQAAVAWIEAAETGQQPSKKVSLPLPEAARSAWTKGARPARLAQARRSPSGWRRPKSVRPPEVGPEMDSRTRALACAVTAAEAEGSFDEAEQHWRDLKEPEQALRCRVEGLDQVGRHADAAELLQKKRRFEAAMEMWRKAGDGGRAAACEAEMLERRHRWDEARVIWETIGETKRAARCRALDLHAREEYLLAAQAWEEAGERKLALVLRLSAAQAECDWPRALLLAKEAGRDDIVRRLKGDRAGWMREARVMGARKARREGSASARRAKNLGPGTRGPAARLGPAPAGAPVHDPVQGWLFSEGETERAEAGGPGGSGRATGWRGMDEGKAEGASRLRSAVRSIHEMIRRRPGCTALDLASLSGVPIEQVKPILRTACESGLIHKSGRARGTRYWPVEK